MQPSKLLRILGVPKPIIDNLRVIKWKFLDTFKVIEIETISTCNRKCTFCPNSKYDRGNHIMDDLLYKKIIDELSEMNFRGRLSPHFYGEPLLDTRLLDFMKYARKKLPLSNLVIYTNGDLLTLNTYSNFIESGVNNFIVTQYDEEPTHNIKNLRKYIQENPIDKDTITFKQLYTTGFTNRGGSIELTTKKIKRTTCRMPFKSVVVDYNGNVVLCCNDFFSSVILGNLKQESLKNIRNKKNNKNLMYNIMKGNFEYDICKNCYTYPEEYRSRSERQKEASSAHG